MEQGHDKHVRPQTGIEVKTNGVHHIPISAIYYALIISIAIISGVGGYVFHQGETANRLIVLEKRMDATDKRMESISSNLEGLKATDQIIAVQLGSIAATLKENQSAIAGIDKREQFLLSTLMNHEQNSAHRFKVQEHIKMLSDLPEPKK